MSTAAELDAPSRHKCLIYEGSPSAQLPVILPLFRDGLADNWRCLYLGSPDLVAMLDAALAASGVDTGREVRRGALILSSDRSHLRNGTFDPRRMIDGLRAQIDGALHDGFLGLCASGDMRWELGDDENFDRLLEYEARLEEVMRDRPLRGICQYHRDIVPQRAVRDALLTHRSAYLGDTLQHDNLFYVPPELLLGETDRAAAVGAWMCEQITRVVDAERIRDRALIELRESEADQRALAEQLAEMNRQLERRVAERTAELTAANQSLESFSYSVSHDLRAPLRAVSAFSAMLARECDVELSPRAKAHLEGVRAGASRMEDLIDGMLSLAKATKADLVRRPVDLTALAEDAVREVRAEEPQRSIAVTIAPGMSVVGDRTLLGAVLQNLLSNAWKFTGKQTDARVEIGVARVDPQRLTFFVRDNGVGFDPAYSDRLFGVFQRLHTHDEFAGTGVGLATVHRIVTRHGGRVWAESEVGKGATFFVVLPRT